MKNISATGTNYRTLHFPHLCTNNYTKKTSQRHSLTQEYLEM